jgi:CubicO group peptidase (beta-lactamase class C family)
MIDEARRTIEDAIARRIFPAAAVEVGAISGVVWREAMGTLTFDQDAPLTDIDTPFDLASLTKVIATATLMMQLISDDRLRLDEPVATFFDEWRGADRESVTIRDLLEHSSGLPARLVDAPPASRREFEHEICRLRLEYVPRARSVYSDLGFILLGFIAADRGGRPLDRQFQRIVQRLSTTPVTLTFELPSEQKRLAAPTLPLDDDPRRGRTLAGEVHDSYAAALGGVAGHAGLFGTASAVGVFARAVLRAASGNPDAPDPFVPARVAAFARRSSVEGSSRGLGWDTMLPTSSCGTQMSRLAFGHVGFTGTSLWIDPARDRYYVFLTNRAYGGGTIDDMRAVRRAFHDALAAV